jgi:hypothetical protein
LPEETNRTRFDKIIARFIEGNVSTTGLTGPEKLLCLEPVCTRWQTLLFKRQTYTQDYKGEKLTKLELLQLKVAFIQWTHLLYVLR